jgi:hypothetical protein
VVDLHHIICDGLSQMILLSEFLRLAQGEELQPLYLQYKDYAEWEYRFKLTDEYRSHRGFWINSFGKEIPSINFPVTTAHIDAESDEGGSVNFRVGKDTLRPILDYLQKEEIPAFVGLLSVYFTFLAQISGQEDIVIGIATSGRSQLESENIVGMFVKMVPFRYCMDLTMSFRDFVKGVSDRWIQANNHQIYDLEDIMNELNGNGRDRTVKLFDVIMASQDFGDHRGEELESDISVYPIEKIVSKYPLSLITHEGDAAFNLRLEYLSAYFSKPDAELLAGQWKSLVTVIFQNLDAKMSEIIGGGELQHDLIDDDITFDWK